jgi:hypothetical protein
MGPATLIYFRIKKETKGYKLVHRSGPSNMEQEVLPYWSPYYEVKVERYMADFIY